MSFDLGDLHLITDRPGATPAPGHGPGDTPDTGPGNGDRPGPCVAVKACGCLHGDLCTHPCDATRDRIELAYAPVVHWLKEAA